MERILSVVHGHPEFTKGGGEVAAYQLHKAYQNQTDHVESAWFLARHPSGSVDGILSFLKDNEYLWMQNVHFPLPKATNSRSLYRQFKPFLEELKPSIIHFHHYLGTGLENLRYAKNVLPDIKIWLTLHEYIAICLHHGQMVRAESGENKRMQLCYEANAYECGKCFKSMIGHDYSETEWHLRHRFFNEHFASVDRFIAPSYFLAERYKKAFPEIENRIEVIENVQDKGGILPPRLINEGENRSVFGYFGQVTEYKGLDLLLLAISAMKKRERKQLTLEIHAANLDWQTQEFQKRIMDLVQPLIDEGCVVWRGAYEKAERANRFAGIDWMVIPSIWWENSPMVIQESFLYGRPIIASNIGGMAEKVRHDIDGLHFEARSIESLKNILLRAATTCGLWERLRDGIKQPDDADVIAGRYLANSNK